MKKYQSLSDNWNQEMPVAHLKQADKPRRCNILIANILIAIFKSETNILIAIFKSETINAPLTHWPTDRGRC